MTKEQIELWESRTGKAISNPVEFFHGQRDCKNGIPYKQGMGEDYERGYCAQYVHEQNQSQMRLV